MVTRETLPPLIRFMGATQQATKLIILPSVIKGLTALPIARMLSRGIP